MNPPSGYSLQRTMIIYTLLIGFAALLVASEFVVDTHSTALKQELSRNYQRYASGELAEGQVYEPLVKIRNQAMMMVGVILMVVVIVLTMFIKTITEPLQYMVEVSKAISAGDLSRTTGVEPKKRTRSTVRRHRRHVHQSPGDHYAFAIGMRFSRPGDFQHHGADEKRAIDPRRLGCNERAACPSGIRTGNAGPGH